MGLSPKNHLPKRGLFAYITSYQDLAENYVPFVTSSEVSNYRLPMRFGRPHRTVETRSPVPAWHFGTAGQAGSGTRESQKTLEHF